MLQQTQVATVLPFFERWMEKFPDFDLLAKASEEDVLHAWQGLGYYSRARNLRKLAVALAQKECLPVTAAEWQQLPGIGPYTAAAVASISFNEPVAVIDGNVVRILSRLLADETPRTPSQAVRHFQSEASRLLDPAAPGCHNEAMMELGATVCFRRNPLCSTCPVESLCAAAKIGKPNDFPVLQRQATTRVTVERLWIIAEGRILLARNSASAKRLANVAELPLREDVPSITASGHVIAVYKRGISNQSITETIVQIPATGIPSALPSPLNTKTLIWAPLDTLDSVTLSGPHRRWINALLAGRRTCEGSGFLY